MKGLVSKGIVMLCYWEANHQNFVSNEGTNVKLPL